MTPEFSRLFQVAGVPPEGRTVEVTANEAERARLAARLGVPAVERLECRFFLRPLDGSAIGADGALTARVRQICVVSDDEFAAEVAEAFSLRFVPLAALSSEIALDGPDEIPMVGAALDLGEAAAEQLALALPPYPRRPDLPEPLESGDGTPTSPFGVLRGRLT